jgi:iron complex outermembrane receptor protein
MLEQKKIKKTASAAAVAAVLSGAAGMAMAQTEASTAEVDKIPEVMVTAQRISQPASKTPLSLSVVSGDDLKAAGAVNASSLTEMVPNVQISAAGGGGTIIAIRGVSSADTSEKGDPSASFNIDGVNLARPQSAGLAFYDLERVEVLRGPQGTLYGRNATAGAINLITNKPVDKFESSAAVELGNYNGRKFDGMLNTKVSDILSLRGAVSSSKHDGYLRSTQGFATNFDDDDSLSGRLQGLFKFKPDLTLLVSTDASRIEGSGPGSVPYATYANASGEAQRTASPSVQGYLNNRARGVSAELNANTSVGALTYQVARRNLDRDEQATSVQARAALPTFSTTVAEYGQTSHELRLASAFGAWKTIAGLYWFKEQSAIQTVLHNFPGLGQLAFTQNPTISQSKAGFGEATYRLSPGLNVTAGLRRTFDDKSREGYTAFGNPAFSKSLNQAAVSYAQTTGKLGVDYALAKSTMVYATLSTGYKAGGFNDGTSASTRFLTYNPEHLSAAEAGVKGRFLNGSLQINASVFGYNYKDLQLTAPATDPVTGAVTSQTLNAAKAKVNGAELEGKYAISSAGKINFSATYLDAHFTSYKPTATTNWSGYSLAKSPKATFGLGYTHNWDLDNGAALTAHIGTNYSASYVLSDYGNAAQFTQHAYHKSDVNLNYSPAGYKWSVQAYIRNLEDKTVMTNYGPPFAGFPATANLAPPRTAGVRVAAYF